MRPARDESPRLGVSPAGDSAQSELVRRIRYMVGAAGEGAVLAEAARAVVEVLGYDRAEVRLDDDRAFYLAAGAPYAEAGRPSDAGAGGVEVPIRLGAERIGLLTAQGAPEQDEDDPGLESLADLLGTILASDRLFDSLRREVRETRDALDRSHAAEAAKDRFLSALSHEIRTPLTSIRSLSEVLLGTAEDEATTREYLSIIHEESMRLTRLTNQLLDLNRMKAGRMDWDFREDDPAKALRGAVRSVSSLAAERGVAIEVAAAPALPRAEFDRDRIVQVLVNLLGNAVKFSPAGQAITLIAETHDGGLRFAVEDHGPGIPLEDRERVFESFRQLGENGDRPPGTGLGLAISRQIVESHGGRIHAEETAGGGARLVFTLPA